MSTLPVRLRKPFYVLASLATVAVLSLAILITAPLVTDGATDAHELTVVPVDRNCADFATWEEAQTAYEAMAVPYRYDLDRDRDGIPCEALRR